MALYLETASRDELIDHIDQLQGQVDSLSRALGGGGESAGLSGSFGLTPLEGRYLFALASGRLLSKEQLVDAVYFDRGDDAPEVKIVDVFICKLRNKLDRYGVEIVTFWGHGYQLSPAGHAIVSGALAGAAPALVDPSEIPPPLRMGRAGTPDTVHGAATRAAIASLRKRADGCGLVVITSRELSSAANLRCAGSTMIRNLEASGHLKVRKAARPGNAAHGYRWTLQLVDVGLRELPQAEAAQ